MRTPNIGFQRTAPCGLAAELGSFGRRIVVVLALGVAAAAYAGSRLDLAVRGVKLGTLEPAVLAALGKPSQTESGRDTEMGMGETLTLVYPGLTVNLCKPEGDHSSIPPAPDFHVWRIRVSGSKWEVSPRLHVGMRQAEVESVLGKPDSTETKHGSTTLHFSPFPFDAFMWVRLSNGVVVEIGMAEDWA